MSYMESNIKAIENKYKFLLLHYRYYAFNFSITILIFKKCHKMVFARNRWKSYLYGYIGMNYYFMYTFLDWISNYIVYIINCRILSFLYVVTTRTLSVVGHVISKIVITLHTLRPTIHRWLFVRSYNFYMD